MKKRAVLGIVIGLLLGYMFAPLLYVQPFGGERATIVVPDDFPTIQEAINNAGSGETIRVKAGTYHENVLVNKSISLIGEDRYNAVIDGSELGTVIEITVSNVSIGNLTVRNAGSSIEDSGIELSGVENCNINGNILIENCNNGIMVYQSIGNAVIGNTVAETGQSGIILYGSNNNTVSENNVQNASRYGIALQDSYYCHVTENNVTSSYEGIVLLSSNRNSVSRNRVTQSASHGIRLDDPSDYNTFTENTVENNTGYGFWMWYSSHNLFYHNLCNNTKNVLVLSAPTQGYNSTNTWDNGYPAGGNYWSDYKGQDLYSGPYQNETGSDGIGDTPCAIDEYNIDRYPLMTPVVIEHPLPNSHRVHNLETGLSYATIQEAIDAPKTLDTHRIFVDNGTYYENVIVTKAVSLIGEAEETTIVDGMGWGSVMDLSTNNVTIAGFTLRNSGVGWAQSGIALSHVGNCNVSGNNITNNYYGMWLESSLDNIISRNNFANNGYGIGLYIFSNRNIIFENNVTASGHAGILLTSSMENDVSRNNITGNQYSVELVSSSNNTITENDITNNSHGVALYEASNYNDIIGNNVERNGWGVETDTSLGNRIYHNNFINNIPQVFFYEPGYSNVWDTSYPGGGNYWSDYNSTDFYSGFYQNETGSDGIADAPYSINSNNEDHYPLMGMFSSFNTTLGDVNVVSNSTIEAFEYFESNSTIKAHVSNMTSNQTHGFCRVCVPHALMNVSNISVIIDNGQTPVLYNNYTLYDNGTHRWIYFAYSHSVREIDIVAELPSLLILPPFMAATLLAVILFRRKHTGQLCRHDSEITNPSM